MQEYRRLKLQINMNKKTSIIAGTILGIIFIVIAIVYWTVPAGSLPSVFPGAAVGSTTIHFKHGLAAIIVSILSFIWVWFASGKKSENEGTTGSLA